MFLVFLLGSEKYDPELKKVHTQAHIGMRMDFRPGFFHTGAPVNVIEDQDRSGMFFFKRHLKIPERRLLGMIAVEIHEVHAFQ